MTVVLWIGKLVLNKENNLPSVMACNLLSAVLKKIETFVPFSNRLENR